jgi:hypothetical protein
MLQMAKIEKYKNRGRVAVVWPAERRASVSYVFA